MVLAGDVAWLLVGERSAGLSGQEKGPIAVSLVKDCLAIIFIEIFRKKGKLFVGEPQLHLACHV